MPTLTRRVSLVAGSNRELIDAVAGPLHTEGVRAGACVLAKHSSIPEPRNEFEATDLLWTLGSWCLNYDHYADAAKLFWSPKLFTPLPECTQRAWDAIDNYPNVLLMGASSMSKSFSCGVHFFLDWLRDPEFTTVKVVGPSEQHLQDNLFSHLVDLHGRSALPMPGKIGDLFIGLSLRSRRSSISGVVIPLGKKSAGRLQGTKRFPRPTAHPSFGALSRLRVGLDEIENVPMGIWSDLDNLQGNFDGEGEGLKIVGAFNPKDPASEVHRRAEPPCGWEKLDPEKDFEWTSKYGWRVVRLDAERCENVVQNKVVYPGLQTRPGLEKLRAFAGGPESAGYLAFGRALYPRLGSPESVFHDGLLSTVRAMFVWDEEPRRVGGADLALEGGDRAILATGLFGRAVGIRYAPSLEHPEGRTVTFKTPGGAQAVRPGLMLDGLHLIPPGKTLQSASALKKMAIEARIAPGWLAVDRTGHGAGVHDILREVWSPDVIGINYSEKGSSIKILEEDQLAPTDEYDRVLTEIWFAGKKWTEYDFFKIAPTVDCNDLFPQMIGRRCATRAAVGRVKVESKKEYRMRQTDRRSPDEVDAVLLMIHAVRRNIGSPLSALKSTDFRESDGYGDDALDRQSDITNTFEYVDI